MLSNKAKVLAVVSRIPPQKVLCFGQISHLVGLPPRVVGWILSGLSLAECATVPWYRVVAKNGFISALKLGAKGIQQKLQLQAEGYSLQGDRVDMSKHSLTDKELKEIYADFFDQ